MFEKIRVYARITNLWSIWYKGVYNTSIIADEFALKVGYAQHRQTVVDRARRIGLVASGARYGFDLIAHVGMETCLHGRSLQDVREELARQQPAIEIPGSSLWDQQQKFL